LELVSLIFINLKMNTADSLLNNIPRKWGDQEEDDEREIGQEITTEAIPDVDGSVRKTLEEIKINEKGQKVKIIKHVRMYKTKVKVNKRVEERKKWKKIW